MFSFPRIGRGLLIVLLILLFFPRSVAASPPAAPRRLLLAHYMPWFQSKPVSGMWGWHWTMNHYDPDRAVNGRSEAASKYRPLIGLYDSGDPDALECHVLLMKLAGIDGVLIDWYGTDDLYDYAANHRNAERLIRFVKKAGLKFAVVYEDQTVPNLIAAHRLTEADAVPHGRRLLSWLQTNWFTDPAYVTENGRPLFLAFGSGYYKGDQWTQIFAGLPQPPAFFTESDRRPPAIGGFSWPQPGGGTDAALREIDGFYQKAAGWPDLLPAAFPRFDDIYAEAGIHRSWGHIDDRDGRTYTATLERALKSRAAVTQLVTWNDWGEGTCIEPSVEYGYRDLEATQRLRRRYLSPKFPYQPDDLRLPVELYRLRKRYGAGSPQSVKLDAIARLLFAGNTSKARVVLAASGLAKP